MRVLVVSEDERERQRATSALELHGDALVVEVDGAAEARRRLLVDREVYDVLVVDGDLTPRGGFAVLYDLRAQTDLCDATVVPALVMVSREHDRWLGAWAGANAVLLKPVDPFELARRVVGLVGVPPVPYGDAGSAEHQVAAAVHDHR